MPKAAGGPHSPACRWRNLNSGLQESSSGFHMALLLLTPELLAPGPLLGEALLAAGTPPVSPLPHVPTRSLSPSKWVAPRPLKGLGFLCFLHSSPLWKGLPILP